MGNLRQTRMQAYIETHHDVTIRELQALFPEVSLMTIHRDLDALEADGIIVKVRGGARSVRHSGDLSFDVRLQENNAGKLLIAQKALKLIRRGSSVFLDAGTTGLVLARSLPDMALNVFTTGPNIAVELCRLPNVNITLCCGTVNRKNIAVSGQNTLQMLSGINIDLALIGVSGCSAEAGFTCGTEGDRMVKGEVIRKARTSVALCDRTKFSRLMPYTFACLSDVDYLISDGPVPNPVLREAERAGVTVL